MTVVSDEMLMRHADGEGSADERRRVEARAAADPEVAARLQAFVDLSERVSAAYRPVLDEPLPAALLATIGQEAPPARSRPWLWTGLAASWLITAAALTMAIRSSDGDPPYIADQGRLYAGAALAAALSETEGDKPSEPMKVLFSYRSESGLCRTFIAGPEGTTAGVACRDQDRWRISTLAEARPTQQATYRMAAGELPASVLAFVDADIVGEPLSPEEEAAARARDWSGR